LLTMGRRDGSTRGLWTIALLAALAALPILSIFALAFSGQGGSWPSNLLRLTWSTILLCGGAGAITLVMGTCLAWLITFYDFPGRNQLKWLALLPLALPGYIISFLYVETFNFAGPFQQTLRNMFGWMSRADYWFPEIRSVGGAALVMSFALFPYVYLAALAAFARLPTNQLYVARTLGRSSTRAFLEVALPQIRPSLFVGVLLVVMECLNDIGAATFFGVGTLTTAVYNTWLDQGDLAGAAQLASLLVLFMALLVFLETVAKSRTLRDGKNTGHFTRQPLSGTRGLIATVAASLPIFLGFVLPVILLVSMGSRRMDEIWLTDNTIAITRTFLLAVAASLCALVIALMFAYVARGKSSKTVNSAIRLSSLGYALPGTVLGLGILVPFARLDLLLNSASTSIFGSGPGLILSGSVVALLFAYVTRFLILSVSHTQDGMNRIPETLDHAARTLGHTKKQVFRTIHIPLLKPAMISAMLLVLVDVMKELPATLILRPFDFETLATRIFSLASLGQFESAAIPALLIVLVGLVPVVVLARSLRQDS
jgi:iron(III) transport system permease protein